MKLTLKTIFLLICVISFTLAGQFTNQAVYEVKTLSKEKKLVVSVLKNQNCSSVIIIPWNNDSLPVNSSQFNLSKLDSAHGQLSQGLSLKAFSQFADLEQNQTERESLKKILQDAIKISECKDARFSKVNNQEQLRSDTQNVYITTADASNISIADRSAQFTNPSKQFYDSAQEKTEYYAKVDNKKPFNMRWDRKIDIGRVMDDFKINHKEVGNLYVKSAKIYHRFSGNLPLDAVKNEMNKARKNHRSHQPSTYDAFKYFVMKTAVPDNNKFEVRHAMVEVCTESSEINKNTSKPYYFRFVLERGSRESALYDTWQTRVKIIYIGQAQSCDLQTSTWMINEVAKFQNSTEPHLKLDGQKQVKHEKLNFEELIKATIHYVQYFPSYNTLVNCQHFAYNLYNMITGDNLDYQAAETMDEHSDASGKTSNFKFGYYFGQKSDIAAGTETAAGTAGKFLRHAKKRQHALQH